MRLILIRNWLIKVIAALFKYPRPGVFSLAFRKSNLWQSSLIKRSIYLGSFGKCMSLYYTDSCGEQNFITLPHCFDCIIFFSWWSAEGKNRTVSSKVGREASKFKQHHKPRQKRNKKGSPKLKRNKSTHVEIQEKRNINRTDIKGKR